MSPALLSIPSMGLFFGLFLVHAYIWICTFRLYSVFGCVCLHGVFTIVYDSCLGLHA